MNDDTSRSGVQSLPLFECADPCVQLSCSELGWLVGDWAAFMTANAVQPEGATGAAPAVASQDSGWDAFQSSEAAAPAASSGVPAAEPFDPFGDSQSVEAAPVQQKAAGSLSAGNGAPTTPSKHAAKKSADDIMKMFDTPQQNAFAQFPVGGMGQGQAGGAQGFGMQQVHI